MPRYTDEDSRFSVPRKKVTGGAFLTPAEHKTQSRKSIERDIVKLLAKVFRLDTRLIGEAVRQETGTFDYLMLGVNRTYSPTFPASIQVANPTRGKGQVFTLNRLLRCPEKYSLVGHFLSLHCENLERKARSAILIGSHPHLGLLAVTDLKMEPDILCFQFSISVGEGESSKPKTLVLAELKHLLLALNRQELWQPDAR